MFDPALVHQITAETSSKRLQLTTKRDTYGIGFGGSGGKNYGSGDGTLPNYQSSDFMLLRCVLVFLCGSVHPTV